MSDGNKKGSFWPSYVDIMTTLFAIMLVLFAVSYSRFKVKEKELSVLADHFIEIIDIYDAVGNIDSTKFEYNEMFSKNIFKLDIEYQTAGFDLSSQLKFDGVDTVAANRLRDEIVEAGNSIQQTIKEMQSKENLKKDIKYLIVVEGQSSRIPLYESEWKNNNTLSYLRAQYLVDFWKNHNLDFSNMDRCELVICGSGEGGEPRYMPDTMAIDDIPLDSILQNSVNAYPKSTKIKDIKSANEQLYWKLWSSAEKRNQRFLIHIVPVIGRLSMDQRIRDLVEKYRNK